MNTNGKIEELHNLINKLTIEVAVLKGENLTLTQMILGVYKEKLDEESFKNIFSNYITVLEKTHNEILNDLTEVLLPTDDHSELIRKKINLKSNYEFLRSIYEN